MKPTPTTSPLIEGVVKDLDRDLFYLIPEKTDNVIIHGYRQLTRGKIKTFILERLSKVEQSTIERCLEIAKEEQIGANIINALSAIKKEFNK